MSDYLKTSVEYEKLKGTKTEVNLHTALSGESQAYLRYKWFEAKAKKDGYVEIADIFCETAANEKLVELKSAVNELLEKAKN